MELQVCNFSRSFIRFRLDTTKKPPVTVSVKLPMTLNNVRMPIECRTIVTSKKTGASREIILGTSCKTEQVWVNSNIWHTPNADMTAWATDDEFVICKQWDKVDKGVMLFPPSLGKQPHKQLGKMSDAFDKFSLDTVLCKGRVLESIDDIIAELASDRPVVSQTEYSTSDHHVLIEYPVKDVNYSERERFYQVDTGPVLIPDPDNADVPLLLGCQMAYVAHNAPDWVEFIINVPTPLAEGLMVHHYSKSVRIDGTINRMIALE